MLIKCAVDDPLVWEGHASIVAEVASQLPAGVRPDAIICAVGGGGLLGGVLLGCQKQGWDDGELDRSREEDVLKLV